MVNSASYSPDGKYIATASSTGTIKIFDSKNGKLIRTHEGHIGSVIIKYIHVTPSVFI